MIEPLISVVIPTFNHAHFLGSSIQSVMDQTYTNWEIIVIDNHSNDTTDDVVNAFGDNRIKMLKVNNNGVIAFSRNVGIREARGEWIAFLDSDDIWYPSKLARCMEKISSGYDLVCHGEYWVKNYDGIRKERKIVYGPEKKATFEQLLFEGNCISTSATVVDRQYLDKVNGFDESPDMITAEDYHLWVKLARAGARIGFVTEILGEYIIHAGNSSKTALRSLHAIQTVFEKGYAEINKHPLKIKIKALRRRAIILYSGARGLQDNKEFWKALPFFLKAILRWPFIPKFYAALLSNLLRR